MSKSVHLALWLYFCFFLTYTVLVQINPKYRRNFVASLLPFGLIWTDSYHFGVRQLRHTQIKVKFNSLHNHNFTLKIRQDFGLLFLSCLSVNIHCCGYIRVPHNLLYNLQIRFILAKSCTECVAQIVRRKMW